MPLLLPQLFPKMMMQCPPCPILLASLSTLMTVKFMNLFAAILVPPRFFKIIFIMRIFYQSAQDRPTSTFLGKKTSLLTKFLKTSESVVFLPLLFYAFNVTLAAIATSPSILRYIATTSYVPLALFLIASLLLIVLFLRFTMHLMNSVMKLSSAVLRLSVP